MKSKFIRRMLNVLYVRPCVICGKPVRVADNINLCYKCIAKVNTLGQTIDTAGAETVSVLPNRGYSRRAMNRFKFKNKKYYGYTFGKLVYDRIKLFPWYGRIECVVAVPMGKRNRLYNQSAVIGENVACRMQVPFVEKALVKVKDNPPFYTLTRQQRQDIIKGAFGKGEDLSFAGKCVLLIDDIYTTGATSGECRRTLLKAGAAKVFCATVNYTVLKDRE